MKPKILLILCVILSQQIYSQVLTGQFGHFGKFVHLKCVANNKVAQVGFAGLNNGDKIYTYNNENHLHFNWQIVDAGDGFIKLRNQNSGKFLAVEGGSTDNYKYIIQRDDDGGDDIKWKMGFVINSLSNFKLINKKSNRVLAIEGGAGQGDAKLVQWNNDNGSDKIWQFEMAPMPTITVSLTGSENTDLRAGSNIMLVLINRQGIKRTYKLNYGEAIGPNSTRIFTIPVGNDMTKENIKEMSFSFSSGSCFGCTGDRWIITKVIFFMNGEATPFWQAHGVPEYFDDMPPSASQYRKIF